jgi:hypothetical protein
MYRQERFNSKAAFQNYLPIMAIHKTEWQDELALLFSLGYLLRDIRGAWPREDRGSLQANAALRAKK